MTSEKDILHQSDSIPTMDADSIQKIVEESSRKLLQVACPPLRYYLLTDLMAKSEQEPIVQRTLDECRHYPPKLKLLQTMNGDGTWPIPKQRRLEEEKGPGPPFGWTYITMLRNLCLLGDMRAERTEGNIEQALERILGWQTKEGYIPGPWSTDFPLPHYNGFALRKFIRYGLEDDPRVRRLSRWLFDNQRPDGGWVVLCLEDMKSRPDYRSVPHDDFVAMYRKGQLPEYRPEDYYDVPSCIWTTMMVVRGFCQSYDLPKRKEVLRGTEFFLDRFFKKNHYMMFYHTAESWTNLRYPVYFGNGLLALDLVTWLGFGAEDPRLEKPIRWLISARGQDGFWHESGRPHPEKDQWITETAISVLNRYQQSMRGLPFGREAELIKMARKG